MYHFIGCCYARAIRSYFFVNCTFRCTMLGGFFLMAGLSHWTVSQNSRKYYRILLALIWLIGLCCGVIFFYLVQISSFPLMRGVEHYSVSIVSLLFVSLLPFLFSLLFVYIRSFPFLVLLCYMKSFLFSFVSMGIWLAYGGAGWLIRLLAMFSDLSCLVPLWWCWIHCTELDLKTAVRPFLSAVLAVTGIVCFDFYFVSPILVRLLEI